MEGQQVGGYRITGQLGRGGMGVVYRAEHSLVGRKAVVKVLLPELSRNQEVVNRFFNEARAASQIEHPGIVAIFDFGYTDDGQAYIVMEQLAGENLAERRARLGTMQPREAIRITRQIASVLEAAHARDIVHRDLKPDNVFLTPDPEMQTGERVKVLDFGIAKLASPDEGGSVRTQTGAVIGTPAYMSPEQCEGAGKVDHRADIYSLGCILYELLCGQPPFLYNGVGRMIAAQITEAPKRVRERNAAVPAALDDLAMALLAKNPDERPQSMGAVQQRLRELARATDSARAASTPAAALAPTVVPPAPVTPAGTPPPAAPAAQPTPVPTRPPQPAVAAPTPMSGELEPGVPTLTKDGLSRPITAGILVAAGAASALAAFFVLGGAADHDAPTARPYAAMHDECDAGRSHSCAELADVYELGQGVEPDWNQSVELRERSCKLGMSEQCYALAQSRGKHPDDTLDTDRAMSLLDIGCTDGHGGSCYELAEIKAERTSGDGDAVEVRALYKRACEGGVQSGCDKAEPPTPDAGPPPEVAAKTESKRGTGTGSGYGTKRAKKRKAKAPRVKQGRAVVRGSLDKDIIRRIVRSHINEVRYCYEKELIKNPELAGRVVIGFTISGNGKVVSSRVEESSIKNKSVESCLARAVKRWKFPKPNGGGIVQVRYPFNLQPSD